MSIVPRVRALAFAMLLAAAPGAAFAHNGLLHQGCDPDAVFAAGDITVSGAFTRAMLPNAPAAGGYFTIVNAGGEADTLTGATSKAAHEIQLHTMSMEGTMMKMAPVEGGIQVPAGGSVTLEPRGLHVMMMDIPVPFKEGECVEVTLHFARAGDVPVVLAIGGTAAAAPPEGPMDMGGTDMTHDHK